MAALLAAEERTFPVFLDASSLLFASDAGGLRRPWYGCEFAGHLRAVLCLYTSGTEFCRKWTKRLHS